MVGRGCQSALTFIYTKLTYLLNKGFFACTLLIDFAKAFDRATTFNICKSLVTLHAPLEAVNWIMSFLSNRSHKVVIGNKESSFVNAKSGTPQGSIISPTLFSILISSLKSANNNRSTFVKYADDLSVIVWGSTVEEL